jgi:hypothetical protein
MGKSDWLLFKLDDCSTLNAEVSPKFSFPFSVCAFKTVQASNSAASRINDLFMVLLVNVKAENAAKPQNILSGKINNIVNEFDAKDGNILIKSAFN